MCLMPRSILIELRELSYHDQKDCFRHLKFLMVLDHLRHNEIVPGLHHQVRGLIYLSFLMILSLVGDLMTFLVHIL